jgi:hypothetical protein
MPKPLLAKSLLAAAALVVGAAFATLPANADSYDGGYGSSYDYQEPSYDSNTYTYEAPTYQYYAPTYQKHYSYGYNSYRPTYHHKHHYYNSYGYGSGY